MPCGRSARSTSASISKPWNYLGPLPSPRPAWRKSSWSRPAPPTSTNQPRRPPAGIWRAAVTFISVTDSIQATVSGVRALGAASALIGNTVYSLADDGPTDPAGADRHHTGVLDGRRRWSAAHRALCRLPSLAAPADGDLRGLRRRRRARAGQRPRLGVHLHGRPPPVPPRCPHPLREIGRAHV